MTVEKSPKRLRRLSPIRSGVQDLAQEVSRLLELDTPALRTRWMELFGEEPSPQFGRTLLLQAIAYRLQERALGGLKRSVQRILDRVVGGI